MMPEAASCCCCICLECAADDDDDDDAPGGCCPMPSCGADADIAKDKGLMSLYIGWEVDDDDDVDDKDETDDAPGESFAPPADDGDGWTVPVVRGGVNVLCCWYRWS